MLRLRLRQFRSATVPATRRVVTANHGDPAQNQDLNRARQVAGPRRDFCDLGATFLASKLPVPEGVDMVRWDAHNAEAFAEPIWETAEGALTDAGTEIVWVAFGNGTLYTPYCLESKQAHSPAKFPALGAKSPCSGAQIPCSHRSQFGEMGPEIVGGRGLFAPTPAASTRNSLLFSLLAGNSA